jgi:hypothetical protein
MAVPLLLLHGGSYFWGEGDVFRTCRRLLTLPPSYMFKCGGLNHWAIQSLGLCLFIIGPYPSPQPLKHEAQRGEVVIVGVRPVVVIVGCNHPLAFLGMCRLPSYK